MENKNYLPAAYYTPCLFKGTRDNMPLWNKLIAISDGFGKQETNLEVIREAIEYCDPNKEWDAFRQELGMARK